MLDFALQLPHDVSSTLAGSSPFWMVFFSTYVLEDVALIGAISLVATGRMPQSAALAAGFLGVASGDLLLFAIGRLVRRFTTRATPRWLKHGLSLGAVAMARIIPAARLPVYVSAGWSGFSLPRFVAVTVCCVALWVGAILTLGEAILTPLHNHRLFAYALLGLLFFASRRFIPQLLDPWQRRALWQAWRRWLHFEFWPAWLFYPPVVIYYIWLSWRFRDPRLPLYANPSVRNGGLVGESKWDYLRYGAMIPEHGLKSFYLPNAAKAQGLIDAGTLKLPFILKPDRGQRGYGVRLLRTPEDLQAYAKQADFAVIAQEFCDWPHEAGIFYVRHPGADAGRIFSLTDKRFPTVTGDGRTSLGNLILRDQRARIIAPVYFARFVGQLNNVPAAGVVVPLATCGNHCQGAIFLNGVALITPALTTAIDRIAKAIPHFYVGRIDIRYRDPESFHNGQHIKLIEVNGTGAEATHIWDPSTRLIDAYGTLFTQWRLLFAIGASISEQGLRQQPVSALAFLQDLWLLGRRNKDLATSS